MGMFDDFLNRFNPESVANGLSEAAKFITSNPQVQEEFYTRSDAVAQYVVGLRLKEIKNKLPNLSQLENGVTNVTGPGPAPLVNGKTPNGPEIN